MHFFLVVCLVSLLSLKFVSDGNYVVLDCALCAGRCVPRGHGAFVEDPKRPIRVVAASAEHQPTLLPHRVVVVMGRP